MDPINLFRLDITNDELQFLLQLFDSDIAITLKTVQIVAQLKAKVVNPQPIPKEETGASS